VLRALQLRCVSDVLYVNPSYVMLVICGMLLPIIGMLLTVQGEYVHAPTTNRTRACTLFKIWLTFARLSLWFELEVPIFKLKATLVRTFCRPC
jgi:hypothetical protein